MTKTIFRTTLLTVFFVLIVSLGLASGAFYQHYQKESCENVRTVMAYIKAGYELDGISYLKNIECSEHITLIGNDGNVIFDSESEDILENQNQCEEYTEAVKEGKGESIRYSERSENKIFHYAERMKDGNVVRLSTEYSSLLKVMHISLRPILLVLLFAGILSILLAKVAARKVMRPINQVDFNSPEHIEDYTELNPLWSRLQQQDEKIGKQMKELSKKQQEFQTLTENMQEGLLMLNSRKEVVSYNSAIMRFFSADIVKRVGNNLYIQDDSEIYAMMEQAFLGERNEQILEQGNRRYQIIATPIKRETGIRGAVILTFDITEKAERDRLRQEFAANVSHELKTPLTSISGFAEIIRDGIVKEEDVKHFADNIYVEAQRMISLVTDIINLSNLEENKKQVDMEDVDLYELASKVTNRLSGNAKKRGIDMNVEGEHLSIQGNYRMLEELIENLCDNAIKYNKENGIVHVQIEKKEEKVLLSVSDTGIGIPKDECERVFERFYRVDKSHSKEVGGTGLGLSIVKHSVMKHRGEITVDSQLGKGTTIGVLFPVKSQL